MNHFPRKPSIKSRPLGVKLDDVMRAVLCDAKSPDEIVEWTGAPQRDIERALGILIERNLVRKTEAGGYEPVLILRRQRRA